MKQELLKKLQTIIREMSVNSLTSIYPDQLLQLLNASQSDMRQFIADLYAERLITYKYRFQCLCGNTCTAYLKKLQREPYICKECGRTYDINMMKEKGTLLYELDKKEILNFEKEDIDFKSESLKDVNVIYLDNKLKKEREIMEIFLGSSSEAKDYMEEIALKLEELKVEPLLWNASGKGIFIPGTNTIDSLIAIAKRVKAAVFIFNADDKIWNDKSVLESSNAVRDNVLFEYGLFMGTLSKKNVCFVCKGKPKLASDLRGITYIDGDLGDTQVKFKLKDWLNAIK
ncbi:MAG: nucleotide-binding protein [Lachnospiraceae bacterium]|nr:nucleotide-binding protein [Lachnospiraceae bacterium]